MKKLKSNEAADKKVPLAPLNHPEFSIVKEQFPPAGTAPNGGAPALPAPPEPVHSGTMSDTVPAGNTGPELSDRSPSLSGESSSKVPKPLILQPTVGDIDPQQLHPHPLNASVYGEEIPDNAFLESISTHCIITALQATTENVVLSGHRRLQAAIKLGLATVPVHVVVDAGDELSQQERILEANRFRLKNNEQLIREYMAFKKIEAEKAKLRKGQRTDLVPKSAPGRSGGKARDFAAEKVNLAGSTAAKGERVVLLIDKAVRSGNVDQVQKLREALNKRINKGYRKAQELGLIALEKSSRAAKPKGTSKGDGQAGAVVAKPEAANPLLTLLWPSQWITLNLLRPRTSPLATLLSKLINRPERHLCNTELRRRPTPAPMRRETRNRLPRPKSKRRTGLRPCLRPRTARRAWTSHPAWSSWWRTAPCAGSHGNTIISSRSRRSTSTCKR